MLILNIALPIPLRRCFDYVAGDNISSASLKPGVRILVPFGKTRERVGVLMGVSNRTDVPATKLKKISSVLDSQPVLSNADLKLLRWTADYYHHPVGEVIFNALPASLKQGKAAAVKRSFRWSLSESGKTLDVDTLKRAPKQMALLSLLASIPQGLTSAEIESSLPKSRTSLLALYKKNLLEKSEVVKATAFPTTEYSEIKLNNEQKQASKEVIQSLGTSQVFLLDGVTGSGKTEVYIETILAVIAEGKQVIILCPEIGLTPQLVNRIASRVRANIAVLHSGLSDTERLQAWLNAKNGDAAVIIGTRSAIWTPLKNPGLFIVDEEHDQSYKQQDGLRYSARDVAVMRGKQSNVPVLLGSATPSMESLHNIELKKFHPLTLKKRAGKAREPLVKIIDLRHGAMRGAVSQVLLSAIEKQLSDNNQVMLFLNRRGYSPTIMCHHCGWIADCERCNMHMTYHKQRNILSCHHCDRQLMLPDACPDCGADRLLEIGHGTERLTETLAEYFPKARILRIDRDSTRSKGSMATMISSINTGDADILIGTQMLAKGHHFPRLTLVGIIDTDGGLCSTDFRASERMAQLFVQVSGRAGREEKLGMVMVQTHFPEHPLLNSLINNGYREFASTLLRERKQTGLPPFGFLALLRSECFGHKTPGEFLQKAATLLKNQGRQLEIYGPIPAPIEKRAGKIRMQLLVISTSRGVLKEAMKVWCPELEKIPEAKKVRWSLDIDPQDMM